MLTTYRHYDPTEGRFLNRDPIGYAGGMNLYGYCGGNPVGRLDPSGLWWNLEDWGNFANGLHWVKPTVVDGFDQGLQNELELFSGIGDSLAFGATKIWRDQLGLDEYVSTKSWLYRGGVVAGIALDIAISSPVSPLYRAGSKIRVPGWFNGRIPSLGKYVRFGYTWDKTAEALRFGFHGGIPRTAGHWHYAIRVPKVVRSLYKAIEHILEHELW